MRRLSIRCQWLQPCATYCVVWNTQCTRVRSYSDLLRPSGIASTEGETVEDFAAKVGLQSLDDRGPADQDLLQIAVWTHNHTVVRSLLALRCPGSPWHRNAVGHFAFDLAVTSANVEALRAIIATGDIDDDHITVPNVLGATSLHIAAENGHLQLVKLLLDRRADVARFLIVV